MKTGHSDGSAPLYSDSVTLSLIYYFPERLDPIGLAINHGSPSDESLDDQITTELFYRVQLSQNLAITSSLQLITDPALNTEENEIWFTGLRARFSF